MTTFQKTQAIELIIFGKVKELIFYKFCLQIPVIDIMDSYTKRLLKNISEYRFRLLESIMFIRSTGIFFFKIKKQNGIHKCEVTNAEIAKVEWVYSHVFLPICRQKILEIYNNQKS